MICVKYCDVYFDIYKKICTDFQGPGSPGVTVNLLTVIAQVFDYSINYS